VKFLLISYVILATISVVVIFSRTYSLSYLFGLSVLFLMPISVLHRLSYNLSKKPDTLHGHYPRPIHNNLGLCKRRHDSGVVSESSSSQRRARNKDGLDTKSIQAVSHQGESDSHRHNPDRSSNRNSDSVLD